MKVFKISIALLLFICIMLVIHFYAIDGASNKMLSKIDALENLVKNKDWENAEKQLLNTQKSWHDTEKWLTTLIHHNEIDEINISLAKLSQYIHQKETTEFFAESATLKLLIKHIPETEKVNLANLL